MIEATLNCHTFKLYSAVLSAFWERRWNNLVIDRYMNLVGCLHNRANMYCTEQCFRGQYERNDWSFRKGDSTWGLREHQIMIHTFWRSLCFRPLSLALSVGQNTAVRFVWLQNKQNSQAGWTSYSRNPYMVNDLVEITLHRQTDSLRWL